VSRVQLALSVSDIDQAVEFLLQARRHRAGQPPPGLRELRHPSGLDQPRPVPRPPLKLMPIEGRATAGSLNHLGVEVEATDEVSAARPLAGEGLDTRDRGPGVVLLRAAGQGLGGWPRRRGVEVYTVLADAEHPAGELRSADPGDSLCCSSAPESAARCS
jgi:hypothetical protein